VLALVNKGWQEAGEVKEKKEGMKEKSA